jgi:hypothetical protein
MPSEIIAAIDEAGANDLLDTALLALPALSDSGSSSLGPFTAAYTVGGTFTNGDVDLIAPGTIRIEDLRFDWAVQLSFGFDLSSVLPDFCLPRVCIPLPCGGSVCTPRICIDWPTISIPVNLADFVEVTADFGLSISLQGGVWEVAAVVQNLGQLQFGPTTFGLLAVIGGALTLILIAIPFIGPFLAVAVDAVLLAIGIAGLLGFLGPILSPFIAGLKIPIYSQPQQFEVLPASGPVDPAVFVTLDAVSADVTSTDEDELVLAIDISD